MPLPAGKRFPKTPESNQYRKLHPERDGLSYKAGHHKSYHRNTYQNLLGCFVHLLFLDRRQHGVGEFFMPELATFQQQVSYLGLI